MLAPWLGGAGVEAAPATTAGARSMLAFWLGGAGMGAGAPTTPAGARRRIEIDEEEEFMVMLAAVLPQILQ